MFGGNTFGGAPIASTTLDGTIPEAPANEGAAGSGWGRWFRWGAPFRWFRQQQHTT